MTHQSFMQFLARWHIRLGWLIGVPVVLWTVTGLIMAARPLDEVRGDHLRAQLPEQTIEAAGLVFPDIGEAVKSARLMTSEEGPVWIIESERGAVYRYSASYGSAIPPLLAADARRIAEQAYSGDGVFEGATFFPMQNEPLELRRGRSSWQVQFDDGTRVYVDDITGEVLAFRTGWWRVFDFMYGLHIMNLETRSDSHHPILIIFAILAVIGSIFGCTLMFRRRKARPPRS